MVIVIVIGALPAIWPFGKRWQLATCLNSGNATTCCQAVNNSLGVAQVVVVAVACLAACLTTG